MAGSLLCLPLGCCASWFLVDHSEFLVTAQHLCCSPLQRVPKELWDLGKRLFADQPFSRRREGSKEALQQPQALDTAALTDPHSKLSAWERRLLSGPSLTQLRQVFHRQLFPAIFAGTGGPFLTYIYGCRLISAWQRTCELADIPEHRTEPARHSSVAFEGRTSHFYVPAFERIARKASAQQVQCTCRAGCLAPEARCTPEVGAGTDFAATVQRRAGGLTSSKLF